MSKWNKILGPGILFAATAIGVSHLVQSTTAGALYGLSMLGFVVLANVLKYPFFEYGSRYAAATGKSIIEGYYDLNKRWLYCYLIITFGSMFFVTAAVGVVTIGFLENLLGLEAWTGIKNITHVVLFGFGMLLLMVGRFNAMEKLIKLLGITLLLTTLIAFSVSVVKGPTTKVDLFPQLGHAGWAFLLPLMGWMPTAVDLSAWNSLWTVEKIKQTGYHPTVKESVREFGLGYWISATLAIFFLIMGAFLVYGTQQVVPSDGAGFSAFVIGLYTESIGEWTKILIASASFSIMLSTFITILDGYTRALRTSFELINPQLKGGKRFERTIIFILGIGGLALIVWFENNPLGFKSLVNTATTLSFLVAPVIAILNFRLVMPDKIGIENSPGFVLRFLSYLGIIFLVSFLLWFLVDSF